MIVTLKPRALKRLQQGHCWIFEDDVEAPAGLEAGPVDVLSAQGKLLGQALFSPKSLIRLRMMTKGKEKIDAALLRQRIERAWELRRFAFPGENAYRLVFGEADFLPGLLIDRYDSVLVFQTLTAGMEIYKADILEILAELFSPSSIVERNDVSVRQKEGLDSIRQVAYGNTPGEIEVAMAGKRFWLDPLEGQKTGFFLDQRFNAQEAARYARGQALDIFCNAGQFAIQASSAAEAVTCVDSSEPAIALAKRNAALNRAGNLSFVCENAFDFLKRQDQERRRYDTIFLDPPAFLKNRAARAAALRGYKEINLRSLRILNAGGVLVTSSCSQNFSLSDFEGVLQEAAGDAGRRVQVLQLLHQAPDHPWLPGMPETRYLKGFILRVS